MTNNRTRRIVAMASARPARIGAVAGPELFETDDARRAIPPRSAGPRRVDARRLGANDPILSDSLGMGRGPAHNGPSPTGA
jgi:hypothetical protein